MTQEDTGGRSGRWLRRERRREAVKSRLKKHGASLQRVYVNAIRKRATSKGKS